MDALGTKISMSYNVQIPGCPLVQSISSLEGKTQQKVIYNYDSLGRLVQTTDAKGNMYTTDYTLAAPNPQTRPTVNLVTTTNPMGYKKATYLDELGRPFKSMDNGDPTRATSSDVTRVLQTTAYNQSGQVEQATNMLGLTTTFEYDFFGRLVQTTGPLGNVASTTYDEATLSASTYLNGELTGTSTKDGLGRIISTESYPDSSDQNIPYFMRSTAQYNGLGQSTQSVSGIVNKRTGVSPY